ncbi:endonuclease/exonuclease/phosphatase family protein [Nocardioides lijunqiniae]|uniref:endonuclease/exonuclease/phosphatase family protein n=1 Tax=Nocardioides lijunqiniae TaxID=2760832 RepID=UPI001877E85B|nr:endonuclease/exonuclease/phosphatase family protein [Nocardioides lijunqiniae]
MRALRLTRARPATYVAWIAAVLVVSAALVAAFVPSAIDVTSPRSGSAPAKDCGCPPSTLSPGTKAPSVEQLDTVMGSRGFERVAAGRGKGPSFIVASFNVLGATHTRGPDRRKGYATAERRLPAQLDLLAAKDVSVAGLQEFQYPQVAQLRSRAGDTWSIYPGTQLGDWLSDNSIIWRTAQWTAVQTRTVEVPYFGNRMTPMPYVLLEHVASGRRVWFANFHNPADVAGDVRRLRARATRIESRLAARLGADGTPVIVTGDMNDREEFACPFARATGMRSSDGVVNDASGCVLPRRMEIDWIFGTRNLTFSHHVADRSTQDRKLSDHPLVSAKAVLPSGEDRPGCRSRMSRGGVVRYCPAA